MAFQFLPSDIVVRILSFLDRRDCNRASTTCKYWRECWYAPLFWRQVYISAITKQHVARINFLVEKKLTSYVKDIEIIWPKVTRRKVGSRLYLDIEHSILKLFTALRDDCENELIHGGLHSIRIRFENPAVNCDFQSKLGENLQVILANSPGLVYLSCSGKWLNENKIPFEHFQTLERSETFTSQIASVKLEELHLALETYFPYELPDRLDCLTIGRLVNLKCLSICWQKVTAQFLEVLTDRKANTCLKVFTLFVDRHSHNMTPPSILHENPDYLTHPSQSSWENLCEKNPGIEIHLTFNCAEGPSSFIPWNLCLSSLVQVQNVTLMKFVQCRTVDGTIFSTLLRAHSDTLEGVVFVNTGPMIELDNSYDLWEYLKTYFTHPKYMAIIGHCIIDDDVLMIARQYGSSLKSFLVTKKHIYSVAESTNFCIPTSSTTLKKLEKDMSVIRNRPWKALKGLPLPPLYYCDGKDVEFYKTGTL